MFDLLLTLPTRRWFSRVVVEGCSLSKAGAFGDQQEDDDSEVSPSSEEEDVVKSPGQTFYVGNGKVKLLERGMEQYVEMVERKLQKRERLAARAGT